MFVVSRGRTLELHPDGRFSWLASTGRRAGGGTGRRLFRLTLDVVA